MTWGGGGRRCYCGDCGVVAVGSVPVVRGLFCDVGLTVGSGVIVCVVGSGVALPPGRSIVERLRDERRDSRVERGEVVDIVSDCVLWVVVPVEPVYETMEGWQESTAGARSWADLPAQAIKYIRRVEELIRCPVALVSTSPERADTILVRDPFAD